MRKDELLVAFFIDAELMGEERLYYSHQLNLPLVDLTLPRSNISLI